MKRLFEAFHSAGQELFLVGGAVRDLAMGRPYRELDDLDFCTGARPRQSLKILQDAGFRTYDVGIEFGTVGAVLKGPTSEGYPKDVQITTYRSKEKYRRGSRHPVVSFGQSIEEDLWRRDFSINSIAMDAEGNYVDPYDGRGDIARGVLRAVGDPVERLAEDPLRILRIARFMAKLGFKPDAALEEAAYHKATWLLEIARQRWLQEMDKLLRGAHAASALEFLARTRALGVILPELVALVDLQHRCPGGPLHPDYWARTLTRVQRAGDDRVQSWAALLADAGRPWTRTLDGLAPPPGPELAGLDAAAYPQRAADGASASFPHHEAMACVLAKGIARRFHFDTATSDTVSHVLLHQRAALAYAPSWTDAQVRRFVQDMSRTHEEIIAFGRLLASQEGIEVPVDELKARIDDLDARGRLHPSLPTGLGQQLIKALGVKPGPVLGDLIDWLKDEQLEDHVGFDEPPERYIDHLRQHAPHWLRVWESSPAR